MYSTCLELQIQQLHRPILILSAFLHVSQYNNNMLHFNPATTSLSRLCCMAVSHFFLLLSIKSALSVTNAFWKEKDNVFFLTIFYQILSNTIVNNILNLILVNN